MKKAWNKAFLLRDNPLRSLTLRKLALVGVLAPLVFLVLYSYLILGPGSDLLQTVWGFPVLIAALGVAITVFSSLMFGAIGRLQRNVERLSGVAKLQNAQLRALNEANMALSQETLTSSVLQRVADLSRELVGARYAALSVVGDDGDIKSFHCSGLDEDTIEAIGSPPSGRGILGLMLGRTEPLRLNHISEHPASVRLPDEHPKMESFLGIPIRHKEGVVGSLYLTEKAGGARFTIQDEEVVQLFANQAAVAIQKARLYERIQALAVETERSRISREMHDGLAQMLSYVNTKAQAVEAFLDNGDVPTAHEHVRELSQAARSVYHDIREGILALRSQVGSDRSLPDVLNEYISEYEHQSRKRVNVTWRCSPDELSLSPLQEVQTLRIIQEALTNVRKHAEATEVEICFAPCNGGLEIEIKDNGVGFDPRAIKRKQWPHFGLQTMQERAEAIGGDFEIESIPGKGTSVRLRVPQAVSQSVNGAST